MPHEAKLSRLNRLLSRAREASPFYAEKWLQARCSSAPLAALDELRNFPFTSRGEWEEDQHRHPPLGRNLTRPPEDFRHIHRSSGTTGAAVAWVDGEEDWNWLLGCSASLFRLSGVRPGQRILLALPFGPSLGAWVLLEGARQAGACCCPSGSAPADELARWTRTLRPDVLVARPTRLLELAAALEALGTAPGRLGVRLLITSGAPGGQVPAVRGQLEAVWKAECFDRYGLTEAGPVAAECAAHAGGLHVLEDEFVAEVVEPLSGQPVADGEAGELVLTALGRLGSPLIRYRTGDRARLSPRRICPCGVPAPLLLGGIGRLEVLK